MQVLKNSKSTFNPNEDEQNDEQRDDPADRLEGQSEDEQQEDLMRDLHLEEDHEHEHEPNPPPAQHGGHNAPAAAHDGQDIEQDAAPAAEPADHGVRVASSNSSTYFFIIPYTGNPATFPSVQLVLPWKLSCTIYTGILNFYLLTASSG